MPNESIYQDPKRPTTERVEDLLSRMTLEEKVGQMCQVDGRDREAAEEAVRERHVGSILHMLGQTNNELQAIAAESRLGIPILFGIDAIHGHAFWPMATIFPTQLGLSCSWNPALVEQVGRVTAREASATGAHWTFSPVLGVTRDLRWGRIDETFGEDPYLIGVLGAAIIRGYQGEDLSAPDTILACAKHFAGYSETQGGRDASEATLTERRLRSLFLKPFRAAVEAGCTTFMTGYQSIDGVPCTDNPWLLRDVLRDEWGFAGFVVTDWDNVGRMHREQFVAPTVREASRRAVEAGNDMVMSTPSFFREAVELVRSGELNEALIDAAVRRILHLKFELGLFDQNRYTDLDRGAAEINCDAHRQLALESAYQSIVLLKNEDQLLPLGQDVRRIAVLGPNADDVEAQLGDWVVGGQQVQSEQERPREQTVTVLDGIRRRAGADCRVDYLKGCDVADPDDEVIAQAAELAAGADVAVVVVGDDVSMNGETRDRADLDLTGAQRALVEAVVATGTPTVVVLINGKPLTIPRVAEEAPAILEAWNPGEEGGTAVAGLLFGDRTPSGKLSVSFPYHVGQQPVTYDRIPGWHGHPPKYVDMPREPLFAFGYGLSYTTFAYANLRVNRATLPPHGTLEASVEVTNTGDRAGVEIVQLYVNDVYSSVTTPVKELKAFARVALEPGQTKTVQLEIPCQRLALIDRHLTAVVEPGTFEVMVGSSSRDRDLLKTTIEIE